MRRARLENAAFLALILAVFGLTSALASAQARWIDRTPAGYPVAGDEGPGLAFDLDRRVTVLVSEDGTWEFGGNRWTQRNPATSPSPRLQTGLAYDTARRRSVLFGGYDAGSSGDEHSLADTWEWDGASWTERFPATSPAARSRVAMAYDSARQCVVLFGGIDYPTDYNDTWEWDGNDWVERMPSTSPPFGYWSVMAYDSLRRVTVLVLDGGTWEWDGTDWMQRAPTVQPNGSYESNMFAYDSDRGRCVLVTDFDGTWEWDGIDWNQSAPPGDSEVTLGAMAYDSARHRTLLFGLGARSDTWQWNGSAWKPLVPPVGPPGWQGYKRDLVFDSARGKVLGIGFECEDGCFEHFDRISPTWEWDGSSWTRLPAMVPARDTYALAFDAIRAETVLFGGGLRALEEPYEGPYGDTWVNDGTGWVEKTSATAPRPRYHHALAFDSARGRTVLFGGLDLSGTLDDTWEWDGVGWQFVDVTVRPAARQGHSLSYDPTRGRTVLFGGGRSDTWEWDGTSWTQIFPAHVPPALFRTVLVFDPILERTILLGDAGPAALWAWDGSDWSSITATGGPVAMDGAGAAFDSRCGEIVLFGGASDPARARRTWALPSGGASLAIASVLPASGSECGGDVVTIRGSGFTSAVDSVVTVGGSPARIVLAACDRLVIETSPGTGPAEVAVSASTGSAVLPGAFLYVDPAIAARFGNVNAALGDRENVLTLNGSAGDAAREIALPVRSAVFLDMAAPSSRATSPYALYAWVGAPSGATLTPLPRRLGTMVFPTPLTPMSPPQPRKIWNNTPFPQLGVANLPSIPAPGRVFGRAGGLGRPVTLAFQGVIKDDGSSIPERFSVTNAVILRAQ